MIKGIRCSGKDAESIRSTKVDPSTQMNDFFDYSKLVVRKPWGYEYLAFQNENAAVWVLFIKRNHQTSMHCHKNKKTSLVLLSGRALFSTLGLKKRISAGDSFIIDKGVFHRTKSLSEEGIYVMEVESPINKRDLIRLKDDYGRENKGYEGKEYFSYNLNNYNHFTFDGPEVYYENKKRFGNSSIRLVKFMDNEHFKRKFDKTEADLVVVLKGTLIDGAGRQIADVGEAVVPDRNLSVHENTELLLVKKKDTTIRLSDYVFSFLENHGVECAFLVAGQLNAHLLDAIGKNNKIRYVFTHHEQAAAMASQAYSKITKKLGVCVISSGASATNSITGVVGSWIDSVPNLVISGQCKTEETIGRSGTRQIGIDEINIVDIVKPVTKYAVMIKNPREIRYHLEKAFYLATIGRPGPVWLDIPLDVQASKIDEEDLAGFHVPKRKNKDMKKGIEKMIELLKKSQRPVILAGNGIRIADAENDFARLVEKLRIPIVTSRNGRDLLAYDNKFVVGGIGAYGDRAANFAVQNSDLLISIGSRLSPAEIGCSYELFARGAKKVVVDIDSKELKKHTIRADIAVDGDAKDFIHEFQKETRKMKNNFSKWIETCGQWKKKYARIDRSYLPNKKFVNAYYFISKLSELTNKNASIVLDRGTSFYVTLQAFKVKQGQRLICSAGISSTGFGIPGSIGAFLANQKDELICICGDGGLQLNIQELQTISYNKIPVKIFVLDNKGHSTIRKTQKAYFKAKFIGTDVESGKGFTNVATLAKAYDLKTYEINNDFEIDSKLARIFDTSGPFLCVLNVSREQYPEPRLVSSIRPDGTLVSRPLEDLYPFLDREELKKNMFIKMVDYE